MCLNMRGRHPKWTEDNIRYATTTESNSWTRIKREVLLENLCVKCGKEMGEHEYSGADGFRCP